ncbi:ANTAR domain-containing response regulator [Paenibacillus sp. MB22_1]|jgi:response regulator NasT|uniref:ANTAR domain-containing response regulator n=2 Tax=Paenibacillus TaxID=44249 RepID=UPI0028FDACB8|nr:ANTAR domain-containing protein [Paenibacillus sp. 3LSP]MDU0332445.1 ANTAR domain-containing protein [Paenibacillus sp. 3LSP]
MRFLLVIREAGLPGTASTDPLKSLPLADPETFLKTSGYQVFASCQEPQIRKRIKEVDAAVLDMPLEGMQRWGNMLLKWKPLPLLWWCSPETASSSLEACETEVPVDGLLSPSMTASELHWALHFSARHFFERQTWQNERAQLVSRLEERKWIDMAKSILCDVNKVSEAEAYDMLRKRAMNERKRMVDVATSVVKAHQQLKF